MQIVLPMMLAAIAAAGITHAQNVVAEDDLGVAEKQPHLMAGEFYLMPATFADRTIVFGDVVTLSYSGADSKATYYAKIALVADSTRQISIEVDGQKVGSVSVSSNSLRTVTALIPKEALADGKFELVVKKESGPNAAVANVKILSSSSKKLGPPAK
ncbi:MAG: hypothetical protein V4733_02005 [Verrucomicrobiota bacterium]